VVGQPVTVSITVTGAGVPPTGTVKVSSGALSCNATLNAGMGNCPLTFASTGTPTITAAYPGDSNYNTSSSSIPYQVGDFSMGVSPASQSVNGGTTVTYNVTVTSINSFAGTVSFGCTSAPVLPAGFSCVAPAPVTVSAGSPKTATFTVITVKGFKNTYNLTFTGTYGYTGGNRQRPVTATLTTKN
jgi:hypothetical protein